MIRTDWPQSAQWPVAFAGFSGGAKRSGILPQCWQATVDLKYAECFWRDQLRPGDRSLQSYQPPADFLNTPIWISSAQQTRLPPPGTQEGVYYSLKRTGFNQVRLEKFFAVTLSKAPRSSALSIGSRCRKILG